MNKTDVIYRNHEETELMKLSNLHLRKLASYNDIYVKLKSQKDHVLLNAIKDQLMENTYRFLVLIVMK